MPVRPYRTRELHDHLVRSTRSCPQRWELDQFTPDGMRPAQVLCLSCGRVTARRDDNGDPWCGGNPVTLEQRVVEIRPAVMV